MQPDNNYRLPAVRLKDFLKGKGSASLPPGTSCRRVTSAALTVLRPKPLMHTLTNSIPRMLRDLGYIDHDSVIVYGAETRAPRLLSAR